MGKAVCVTEAGFGEPFRSRDSSCNFNHPVCQQSALSSAFLPVIVIEGDAVRLTDTLDVSSVLIGFFVDTGQTRSFICRQSISNGRRVHPDPGVSKIWQDHQARFHVPQVGCPEGQAERICFCGVLEQGCQYIPPIRHPVVSETTTKLVGRFEGNGQTP